MKTSLSAFVAIIFLISSCISNSDKTYKKFTLQGEISGQDSGKIVLRYKPYSSIILDTARIENGKFAFTGMISEPTRAQINGGNDLNSTEIYLEPGVVKVMLTKDYYKDIKVIGSKTQEEEFVLNKMIEPTTKLLSANREKLFSIYDSIKKSTDEGEKLLLEKKYEEINILLSQEKEEIAEIQLGFIISHPKSYVSPYYLLLLEGNGVISLDSLKSVFSGLDITIQNSINGDYIKEDIRKKENIQLGMSAPDFKTLDINQQTITLNQFRNKNVVLLDFWASWCVPCREDIPFLKDIYKKYHSKGFEIVGVSTDLNRNAWLSAIKQDSTEMWFHIPIAEQYAKGPDYLTNDDIKNNYFIQVIPVKILIDKDGKIVGKWVGGSKEIGDSLESKLETLFR